MPTIAEPEVGLYKRDSSIVLPTSTLRPKVPTFAVPSSLLLVPSSDIVEVPEL